MTPKMVSTLESMFSAYMASNYPGMLTIYRNQNVPEKVSVYTLFHVVADDLVIPTGLGIEARSRCVGIVQVDIIVPSGGGAGYAGDFVHDIGQLFKRRQVEVLGEGLVTFKDPATKTGRGTETQYREIVKVPYYYDFST